MIVSLKDFLKNSSLFIEKVLNQAIFVYPTDTIYWIWGIWNKTLKKIYEIKQRPENKKVSIILPANNLENFLNKVENILEKTTNFSVLKEEVTNLFNKKQWFTILIKAKARFFNQLDSFWKEIYKDQTIWIRYLNHPFQKFVNQLNTPFITTSANLSWQKNITNINQLPKEILQKIDVIIDDWELNNPPSTLIDFRENEIKIIKRS